MKVNKLIINNIKSLFFWLLVSALIVSCTQQPSKVGENIVEKWTGKTILFPNGIPATVDANGSNMTPLSREFKILVYTDSLGCTSCKLRISTWKQLIHEMDTLAPEKVGFLFWFHPQNDLELKTMLKNENIAYPVFIDHENEINNMNNFPTEMEYQAFLLDKDNNVVLVGNPTLNVKIWELYKQYIINDLKKRL